MTPHVSNTCWDNWSNCGSLAATHCYQSQISSNCCLSCGLGNTMTTHVTPHTAHPWCRSRHDPRGQQHLLRHLLQLRLAVRLLLRQPLQEGVWPLLSGAGRGGAGRGLHPTIQRWCHCGPDTQLLQAWRQPMPRVTNIMIMCFYLDFISSLTTMVISLHFHYYYFTTIQLSASASMDI